MAMRGVCLFVGVRQGRDTSERQVGDLRCQGLELRDVTSLQGGVAERHEAAAFDACVVHDQTITQALWICQQSFWRSA